MANYIPITNSEQVDMLHAIGMQSFDDLFKGIPSELQCGELDIQAGLSELGVRRAIEEYAKENTVFPSVFRGAGAYKHYIPSIVKQVSSKETFLTAYTPYQAEISQGILQAIFEFQTEMCMLTGMDISNASVYDGATAAAEATIMCRERTRQRVLIAESSPPDVAKTIKTYCACADAPVESIPTKNGQMDIDALKHALNNDVACLYLQYPNYFGLVEDVQQAAQLCHAAGAKLILGCNPIALALYQTPKELGADIAVGEAQPLGLPLAFGGPYLGFMACGKELMRKIPGRIVGQTLDADKRRCFVLTLQAREQHIRREKALSSICSNQALCALTTTVYLAAMGPCGLRQVAEQCYAKAHYAAKGLAEIGFARVHSGPFFHEFLTACPVDASVLMAALEKEGILGGLPVKEGILWCCTEMNTKEEIDTMVATCRKAVGA